MWTNSINLDEQFENIEGLEQLEMERMEQIKRAIPEYGKGFPWKIYEEDLEGIPLKHLVQSLFYSKRNKFFSMDMKN